MKTAAIALDKYKLKVFEDALKRAGFKWTQHQGLTPDTLILKAKYDGATFDKLQKVISAANEVATIKRRT